MEEIGDFLLALYRAAREHSPKEFRERVLDRVRKTVPGSAALWGEARRTWDTNLMVPTALHIQNLDTGFLSDWARFLQDDRAAPLVLSNPGRLLRVDVPIFYGSLPELANLARRHQLQAMNCILLNGTERDQVHWLSLFSDRDGSVCADGEHDWLEFVMPHLSEAWRINAALNLPVHDGGSGCEIGVAESATGVLLIAGAGLLTALADEWHGFDGTHAPRPMILAWQERQTFVHLGRAVRIEGRRFGELVYLSARHKTDTESLTARQLDIASLFAQGLTNKQIAKARKLSPATVRNHLACVYETLGVHGRTEMTRRLGELKAATADPAA